MSSKTTESSDRIVLAVLMPLSLLLAPASACGDTLCCPSVGGGALAETATLEDGDATWFFSIGHGIVGSVTNGVERHAGVMHCYALRPNPVNATVELVGVPVPEPGEPNLSRCIKFLACNDTYTPSKCATPISFDVEFTDTSVNGWAKGTVRFSVDEHERGEDPETWETLCAKDEQHTLDSTLTLSIVEPENEYHADGVLALDGGDTDNDNDVNETDVTNFLAWFGSFAAYGGCPWDGTCDADFSNNGAIMLEDYAFLVENWGPSSSTCPCEFDTVAACVERGDESRDGPVLASQLPPWAARKADLNGDGVVDFKDVEVFELEHGLPPDLSAKMKATAAARSTGAGRSNERK